MNRIIIEGPTLTNKRLYVSDIDEAIEQLHKLKVTQQLVCKESIQRFKGLIKKEQDSEIREEDWYMQ